MDGAELLRMNRMLEVEALSFQLQLEKAVSHFLVISFYLALIPSRFAPWKHLSLTFPLCPGLLGYQPVSGGGRSRTQKLRA